MTWKQFFAYRVAAAHVVVTALGNQLVFIEPNTLVENGVIPADWIVKKAETSQGNSELTYENGLQLVSDITSSVQFYQEISPDQKSGGSYLAHDIARKYLQAFPHTPYNNIGLNSLILIDMENESKVSEGFISQYEKLPVTSITHRIDCNLEQSKNGPVTCNIRITPGTNEKTDMDVLSAIINLHHSGPLSSEEQISIIDDWKKKHGLALSFLDRILENYA